jgi:hypothetical protein
MCRNTAVCPSACAKALTRYATPSLVSIYQYLSRPASFSSLPTRLCTLSHSFLLPLLLPSFARTRDQFWLVGFWSLRGRCFFLVFRLELFSSGSFYCNYGNFHSFFWIYVFFLPPSLSDSVGLSLRTQTAAPLRRHWSVLNWITQAPPSVHTSCAHPSTLAFTYLYVSIYVSIYLSVLISLLFSLLSSLLVSSTLLVRVLHIHSTLPLKSRAMRDARLPTCAWS